MVQSSFDENIDFQNCHMPFPLETLSRMEMGLRQAPPSKDRQGRGGRGSSRGDQAYATVRSACSGLFGTDNGPNPPGARSSTSVTESLYPLLATASEGIPTRAHHPGTGLKSYKKQRQKGQVRQAASAVLLAGRETASVVLLPPESTAGRLGKSC
ncbi:uncharacterized protein B0I36DRAFT_430837 [Microdochium trichocladiopsis]|uniref:Uncharacterized protein n=1 Tax=Microdochium trichocladiopsis TaxID=1682393 RepID=A0A9P8YCP2_9PEZI|nr:uncharacterized protein B0I36DRAFT_430837 [Microdochium trichocladiopsis]KAH7033668.1 hypothetical protein B0I36DRAFT_430837 [Microdochium trichocladiopsis]